MSWNNRNRNRVSGNMPPPPRAFMGSNEAQIIHAIKRMAAEQRWLAVRDITVEDLRQLFIPAEYRHSLKEAFSLAAQTYLDQSLETDVPITDPMHHLADKQCLVATFKWDHNNCPHGFFVLRDSLHTLQPDISDELRDKWNYVVDSLGRISWQFGLVTEVFKRLNQNAFCNTPQQMRFVWPAIRHLVDKAGIKGLNLVEASARAGDRARVPVEIRELLVPAMNIVNSTLLIDKVDMSKGRECRLHVNEPQYVITTPETGMILFNGVS